MRSIASANRALPSAERCDRPRTRVSILPSDQPGGFGQGPEEKLGCAGIRAGRSVKITLLAESARRVGTAWPADSLRGGCGIREPRSGRERFAGRGRKNGNSLLEPCEIFNSPHDADDSSRDGGLVVEFVNHPG